MKAASVNGQSRLQKFLATRLQELQARKSQLDIATEVGFSNANFISMLKVGKSKLALDRVPAMARALDVDPAYLFRLALEQFLDPDVMKELNPFLRSVVTENENEILDIIRTASDHSDPAPTLEIQDSLKAIFGPKSGLPA